MLDLSSSGPGTAPGSRSGNVIGRYATGIGYETIYGSSSGPRRDTAYALLPPLPTYHSQVQQSGAKPSSARKETPKPGAADSAGVRSTASGARSTVGSFAPASGPAFPASLAALRSRSRS